jgi:hypothetical protein
MSPWLFCLVLYSDGALGYAENYKTLAQAMGFAVIAVAGLVCESLGTWIEVRWDKERDLEFQVDENWFAYLALTISPEPVGYRYLSRLATMLYFELSMMSATVFSSIGLGTLLYLRFPERSCLSAAMTVAIPAVIIVWFTFDARKTHQVLCKTRRELNQRLAKSSTKSSAC